MPEPTLRQLPFDHRSVRLTPEEGFVLSRIDQPVFARDLAAMTGLPTEQVNEIVARLIELGALAVDLDGPQVRRSLSSIPGATSALGPTLPAPPPARPSPAPPARTPPPPTPPAAERGRNAPSAPPTSTRPSSGTRLRSSNTPPPTTEGLQLYERSFSSLAPSARANLAQKAEGDDLVALCHDSHPQVVLALLANPHFTSRFARLVALYHKNPSGLDLLARSREHIADPKVQLCLLLNPHLTEAVLQRLARKCTLGDLHRLGTDPRVPEDIRQHLVNELRERFGGAPGEERADLVYWSEGRVLDLLRGCTFDERTTSLLSKKSYTSAELVERLASFPATPTALLQSLLRQPLVRDRPDLAELIGRHPHAPRRAASHG